MKGDPQFTLFWRGGKREIVEGRTIAEAMTLAGYSGGAVRALDFYAVGADPNWTWVETTREWIPTLSSTKDAKP